jgi:hypothetical protein
MEAIYSGIRSILQSYGLSALLKVKGSKRSDAVMGNYTSLAVGFSELRRTPY